MKQVPHYLVIGGGIAGLSTAYLLSLLKPLGSYKLSIIEGTNRWGGWIQTIHNSETGALYEIGPHSARTTSRTSKLFMRLIKSLDLDSSLLYLRHGTNSAKKFIYAKGKLIPVSFFGFRTQYPFTRSSNTLLLRKFLARHPKMDADCTIDEFFRSRFDSEFADYYASAMTRGIFAGDSRKLSVQACLPQFVEVENRGLINSLGRLLFNRSDNEAPIPEILDRILPINANHQSRRSFAYCVPTGMQTITDVLADKLKMLSPHFNLYMNTKVKRLLLVNNKFKAVCENGHQLENEFFDAAFLACPSFESCTVLSDILPPNSLARLNIDNLPWESVACAALEVVGPIHTDFQGFGHLVPAIEDANILGVIYDSVAFPQLDGFKGGKRYTVMMKPDPSWLDDSESSDSIIHDITQRACFVLQDHLKINNPTLIGKQCRVLKNCIPQYPTGHVSNISNLRNEIAALLNEQPMYPNLHLVGNSYDGVGLSDSVYSAAQAVSCELKRS